MFWIDNNIFEKINSWIIPTHPLWSESRKIFCVFLFLSFQMQIEIQNRIIFSNISKKIFFKSWCGHVKKLTLALPHRYYLSFPIEGIRPGNSQLPPLDKVKSSIKSTHSSKLGSTDTVVVTQYGPNLYFPNLNSPLCTMSAQNYVTTNTLSKTGFYANINKSIWILKSTTYTWEGKF